MSEMHGLPEDQKEGSVYEIRVRGHLNHRWAGRFESMTITLEANGTTLLTGPLVDQAALHGLLKKVRDSGLPLISVNPVEHGSADAAQPAAAGVNSSTGADSLFTPDQSKQGV